MDSPTSPAAGRSSTTTRGRRSALGLVGLVLITMLAFVGVGPLVGTASAQTANNDPAINSWSAYANYPNTLPDGQDLPAGCTALGLLQGLTFSVNGGPAVGNMADLPNMLGNDVLSMDWTGWTEGCETLVTLSVKAASTPDFQPTTDQALVDFVACSGPDDVACTVDGGGYHLELVMPPTLCNYQTDAVVGPPLDVVGPSGSFYSNVWRFSHQTPPVQAPGDNMLISADNGGPTGCAPPAVASVECDAQGAVLEIFNPSLLNTVRAEVFKDGVSLQDPEGTGDPGLLVQVPKNSTVPVVIPATPADGTFQITVVVAGDTIYDQPFTNDCTDVTVGAVADCAEGAIELTATNDGQQPVTITAEASTPTGGVVPVALVGGVGSTPASETESTTITFFVDGVPFGEAIVIPPCTPAVAAVQVACQEGEVEILTTQPTGYDVEFDVTASIDGEPVDVVDNGDGTYTVASGREAVEVLVTADGEVVFDGTVPACDDPGVVVSHDCEVGAITVTTTQPGTHAVTFVVTADGTPVALVNGVATTPSGDAPVRIVVTADGETLLDETVQPCDDPEADATVQCSNTTITVTTTQPTDHTVDFLATANGTPLVLTNGTATTPIGATPVTIVVTADGAEIHRETIQPCTEVQGVQQTRTPAAPSQLPRTGAEAPGQLALAIGMVLIGFGLVLAADDRRIRLLGSRS